MALNRDSIEDNVIKVVQGKGGKDRITYIDTQTKVLIDKYISERNDSEMALFLNKSTKRLSVRSIERMIKKYALLANIKKDITPILFVIRLLPTSSRIKLI